MRNKSPILLATSMLSVNERSVYTKEFSGPKMGQGYRYVGKFFLNAFYSLSIPITYVPMINQKTSQCWIFWLTILPRFSTIQSSIHKGNSDQLNVTQR